MRKLSKLVFDTTIEEPRKVPEDYPTLIMFSTGASEDLTDVEYFIDNGEEIKSLPKKYRDMIINKQPFEIEIVNRKIIKYEIEPSMRVEWEGEEPLVGDLLMLSGVKFIVNNNYLLTPLSTERAEVKPGDVLEHVGNRYNGERKITTLKFTVKSVEY